MKIKKRSVLTNVCKCKCATSSQYHFVSRTELNDACNTPNLVVQIVQTSVVACSRVSARFRMVISELLSSSAVGIAS